MQAEIEDVRQSAALGFAQGGRIQARQHSATSGVVVAHPWSAASREHAPDVDRPLIDSKLSGAGRFIRRAPGRS